MSVKISIISDSSQIIVVVSDVTKVKDLEKEGLRLRSQFFSSVAHELKTPINSIIPILKLVLQILSGIKSGSNKMVNDWYYSKIEKLIQIAHCSAQHLESMIEDAHDISSFENNQFQTTRQLFNLRNTCNELADIVKFQIEQKGLEL